MRALTAGMPNVNVNHAENLIYTNFAKGNEDLKAEGLAILAIIVKKDGTVRASKPKVKDAITGKAAYVWRMVVFITSPKPAHSCMPCTCDWDLPVADENGVCGIVTAYSIFNTLVAANGSEEAPAAQNTDVPALS